MSQKLTYEEALKCVDYEHTFVQQKSAIEVLCSKGFIDAETEKRLNKNVDARPAKPSICHHGINLWEHCDICDGLPIDFM